MYFCRVTKVQISSSDDILPPRDMDHDARGKVQSVSQVHSSLYKFICVTPILPGPPMADQMYTAVMQNYWDDTSFQYFLVNVMSLHYV